MYKTHCKGSLIKQSRPENVISLKRCQILQTTNTIIGSRLHVFEMIKLMKFDIEYMNYYCYYSLGNSDS